MAVAFNSIRESFFSSQASEREFFAAWIARDEGFLPQEFPYAVAILHPGTVEVPGGDIPYLAPNPHDDDLDDEQAAVLDQIIGSSAPEESTCNVAFYGGFMEEEEEAGLIDAGLDRVSGRLKYLLGATLLAKAGVLVLRESLDLLLEPSYIWPDSREWFVASAPDLAFTVVGCQQELAQRLLDAPGLDSRLWQGPVT
ncbi:hypothetical protein ICL81_09615 [Leucobacter sp. cx-328]|uniref:hypothetical protein n=1 Tax=unclassified Leucobacter TaxID=2621730 RepID=UPI00165D887C|nr:MULTISPECIES: hypothetical protein [unclassified Leucobacter]MBC9944765.1 hypothetical protein [Leucobacter sp. cx-328]